MQLPTGIPEGNGYKMHDLPIDSFLRLRQIVGTKTTPGIIPISKSSWWAGVKEGRFPQPIKLGTRTTVWRMSDIRQLVEKS
ncbi:MAG: AlpA family phage regulatory protein [Smithella sp.]|nr:AlpA family phage regulatory protein [Smithella sp.]